ncbi:uncharacterized protein ACHE_30967A [Aspergillus chevalieri]|uniref:Uncharacterized protein n=1 Tax=Aspergillus chevalieri TaxID=182096 RepID=A0A7R7VLR5_ASPCH|nr:uncharacterized protein ACHE_30967A [Aspergillus chevalieri]BCR86980.1 hypothetical protein ACHE_30967A [Aspergillus chevalieri]
MSDQTNPIFTHYTFADAIKELPLSALFAKASELQNSIAHLHRSNDEMKIFITESCESEEDKREIEGYVSENEGVLVRFTERIALLKAEVERRGQQWIEVANTNGTDTNKDNTDAQPSETQPVVNGTVGNEARRDGADQETGNRDAEGQNGIYL